MKSFRRMLVGSDVRLNRLLAVIEAKFPATRVPTTWETKVLTAVAWISPVVISVIVFDIRNPFSLIGVVLKALPYLCTWQISRDYKERKRLPLYLAVGLVAYFLFDAYVSFEAIYVAKSSTAPIAAFMVMATSFVIVPAGALITFGLVRLVEGASKSFRC